MTQSTRPATPLATPPAEPRRLYRSTRNRLIGGVCEGLSEHLGVDVWLLRLAFILSCPFAGSGAVAYACFWLFVPLGMAPQGAEAGAGAGGGFGAGNGTGTGTGAAGAVESARRPSAKALVLAGCAVALVLLLGRGLGLLGLDGHWGAVGLLGAVCAGLALLWRQADDGQRSRWLSPQRPRRPSDLARAGLGALVVLGGIAALVASDTSWTQASRALIGAVALLAGVVLIALPYLLRIVRDLSAERAERIRSQERAEVAAVMHDSVLHTLTLIQRRSTDPLEVVRLARAQERDLRTWLYAEQARPDGAAAAPETFARAVKDAVAEVEDRHGVVIEVVAVGDAPLDDALRACVAAAREAAVNAAKYAAGAPITVYAEVEVGVGGGAREKAERVVSVQVYVRDRGPGFDLDTVAADRMGIRESIVGRMTRHGGTAVIKTAPGEGTEVRLELRCD